MPPSSARSGNFHRDPAHLDWLSVLQKCAEAALPNFLQRQRWYPAKDADAPVVTISALLPFAASRVPAVVAVWQVTPPSQSPMNLFIPVALVLARKAEPAQVIASYRAEIARDGEEMQLVEAFSVDEFVRAWVNTLLRGGEKASGQLQLRTGRTEQLARAGLEHAGNLAIRRGSAEQSNTSIRVGDDTILKVIRKLERGVHPELEVSRFLTEAAGFAATPSLLAWAELGGPGSRPDAMTLSILQAFVQNEGDGWSWVLERLARAADSRQACEQNFDDIINWIRQLGRRSAEMHAAFETDSDDSAFRPEPVQLEDVQRWVTAAEAVANRALDGIRNGPTLEPPDRALAEILLARRGDLVERLRTSCPDSPRFSKIRHHGDYHLGQVLVTDSGRDAVIIDFEGEPLRPLAERRAKHAALRDIAGMLRSFAYAKAAASRALAQDLAQAERASIESRLAAWERAARQAYLESYFEAARSGSFCPKDRLEAGRVLRFFMLEKALYEIAYELANRPDWVAIPLLGVAALLDQESAVA